MFWLNVDAFTGTESFVLMKRDESLSALCSFEWQTIPEGVFAFLVAAKAIHRNSQYTTRLTVCTAQTFNKLY